MSDLFKHVDWTVAKLVSEVQSGELRLPEIQRPFVWTNVKARELIDSLYHGYPVGELMLWNVATADDRSIGAGGQGAKKPQSGQYRIVDGQQRLTSLYAVMTGKPVLDDDYRTRRIQIAFNPFTERFEVWSPAIEAGADWLPNIATVFDSPLSAIQAFRERSNRDLDDDDLKSLERTFDKIHTITKFPFKVVTLEADVDPEKVAEIFVRINSEGVKLNQADFILTRLSVFWDEGREEIEEFSRNSHLTPEMVLERTGRKVSWTPKNHYIAPDPGQILRVIVAVGMNRGRLANAYAALRGRDPRTGLVVPENRDRELGMLKKVQPSVLNPTNWNAFLHCLGLAGFRSKNMVASQNALLYTYVLWLKGRLVYKVDHTRLRALMARWFFMAQTTRRYTSSPETAIEEDLNRFSDIEIGDADGFISAINQVIDTQITGDFWTIRLPDDLITSSRRSPAYQAYLAALNILGANLFLLREKLSEWMDPSLGAVASIEYHHLFPRAHLRMQGITDRRMVNQVAQFAPTDFATNKEIGGRAPFEYWTDLVHKRGFEGEELENQRRWHALPDNWENMEYNEFLRHRRLLMAEVIREAFTKLGEPNYRPLMTVGEIASSGKDPCDDLQLMDLVNAGLLKAGDLLTKALDSEETTDAEITEDGLIGVDGETYDTPARAARADGDEQSDGWSYWALGDEDPPRTLRDLAIEYRRREAEGA